MNTLYTFFTGIALLFSNLFGGNHANQQPVINPSEVSLQVNENLKSTSTEIAPGDTKVVTDAKDLSAPKFRVLKLYDNEGKKAVLSAEDSSIVDTVISLIKDDKKVGWHLNDINQIVISSGYAFLAIGAPKGGCSENDFVIDIKNKKITDTFGGYCHSNATQNSIVIGNDRNGFLYYIYGEPSSVKIQNSVLIGNQSYIAFDGPMGSQGYKVIATTTNTITFGIFDRTIRVVAPGDDTGYYKKIGEKTFIIPSSVSASLNEE